MAYTTIDKSSLQFNNKLYTGTGSSNAQTGLGFQPDWVWLKCRSNSGSNKLMDAVRGSSSSLCTNNTNAAEGADYFSSFDSDGFTVATTSNDINANGRTYVGWNWKANGQGSSNTDGSINTTYTSANTTAGFSIVQYTGTGSNATVGHGLGVAPSWIITKSLVATQEWCVYHKSLGATKYIFLNETSGGQTGSVYWQDTAPTSSVFSVGASGPTNSASAMIAYCFVEKKGFSNFSSYTGNGSTNGAFVYTGFSPAFLLVKSTSSGRDWILGDNKRLGYNAGNKYLVPNSTNAEDNLSIDFLSNGFKLRTSGNPNVSGETYIYMCFAAAPLVGSNNIPANAR